MGESFLNTDPEGIGDGLPGKDWKGEEDDPLDIYLDRFKEREEPPDLTAEDFRQIKQKFQRGINFVDLGGLYKDEARERIAEKYEEIAESVKKEYDLDLSFESHEDALSWAEEYLEAEPFPW